MGSDGMRKLILLLLAAETLVKLGYTNIKEFGGIIDWPYEVE